MYYPCEENTLPSRREYFTLARVIVSPREDNIYQTKQISDIKGYTERNDRRERKGYRSKVMGYRLRGKGYRIMGYGLWVMGFPSKRFLFFAWQGFLSGQK